MVGFHFPLKKLGSFVEKPFLLSVRTVFNRLLQHKCLGIQKPPTCLTKQAMRALPMTAPLNLQSISLMLGKKYAKSKFQTFHWGFSYYLFLSFETVLFFQMKSFSLENTFSPEKQQNKAYKEFQWIIAQQCCSRLDQIFISSPIIVRSQNSVLRERQSECVEKLPLNAVLGGAGSTGCCQSGQLGLSLAVSSGFYLEKLSAFYITVGI